MKKNKLLVLTALASMALLSACNNGTNPSPSGSGGGGGGDSSADDGKITVNFYIDFNTGNANKEWTIGGSDNAPETYAVQRVENGSKVSKPEDPKTPPFSEFPVFLGWSKKEVIDNKNDLWNFDTDTINTDTKTFSLYGCWAAEGES